MKCSRWKRRAAAVAGALTLAVGIGGMAIDARAMTYAQGDLVLAMYANGTEYYRDLGAAATLLANGSLTSINIGSSALNPLTATAGSNPVFWSLLSAQGTTQLNTFINTSSRFTAAQIIGQGSNNLVTPVNSTSTSWRSTLSTSTGPSGTETVLSSTDPGSFTTAFGVGGTLGGNWTGGGQQGGLDEVLNMVRGDARIGSQFNVLSDVGRVVLSANGILTICGGAGCDVAAVPVPAAAILFGSGLVGMAGIARRKASKVSA